jgi:hypothetical protein
MAPCVDVAVWVAAVDRDLELEPHPAGSSASTTSAVSEARTMFCMTMRATMSFSTP